jgi:hypothetical protein
MYNYTYLFSKIAYFQDIWTGLAVEAGIAMPVSSHIIYSYINFT